MTTHLDRQSKHALYLLKREYGGEIDIYKLVNSQTEVRTGKKIVAVNVIHVRRAVILPALTARKAVRGVPAIAAAKDFIGGGEYDSATRQFLVDRADASTIETLTVDDWIVFSGRKYQIKSVESFEFDAGWLITATESVGEKPQRQFDAKADNLLDLTAEAE